MNVLLIAGFVLRLAVLISADPGNADLHEQVIEYIAEHRSLPISNVIDQSYQPPLYYVLVAPLWMLWRSPGPIHFVSFVLSCANLLLIRRLLSDPLVIAKVGARLIAFAFACFLPEFVMFSGFISNDALAFPVGTFMFLCALRYIVQPSTTRLMVLAIAVGIGLLTKGTFLASGFAMLAIVWWIERTHRPLVSIAAFCLIFLALGCYKYVENYRTFWQTDRSQPRRPRLADPRHAAPGKGRRRFTTSTS